MYLCTIWDYFFNILYVIFILYTFSKLFGRHILSSIVYSCHGPSVGLGHSRTFVLIVWFQYSYLFVVEDGSLWL